MNKSIYDMDKDIDLYINEFSRKRYLFKSRNNKEIGKRITIEDGIDEYFNGDMYEYEEEGYMEKTFQKNK